MDAVRRALAAVIGERVRLPRALARPFPELEAVRIRRGGLPVRVGGWALGQRTVAAITLWRTIFVAPDVPLEAELLLHELRHVHQFEAAATFPVRYLWESIRRGYHANRYEADARRYATERLRAAPNDLRRGEVSRG
ncbi:MAG TPA: hypothetical protein VFS44_04435 [Gemmatimonadaceae bacterium]|nr:hypothetical protein [Gemmatimonadaceae bacterium]